MKRPRSWIGLVVAAGVALALIHWKNNSSEQATGTPAALFGSAQSVIRHSESTIGAATTPVQAPVPNTSSEPESLDPALATPPPQNPLIDHFPGAKLVAWTDLPANTEGYAQRVLILETNFRFPLVRMTVERKLDAHGKVIAVRDREMMAADHVLLERAPGLTPEAFMSAVARAGGKADPEIGHTGHHLVHFDGRDPAALPKMIDELQRSGAGAGPAEPDFIRQLK